MAVKLLEVLYIIWFTQGSKMCWKKHYYAESSLEHLPVWKYEKQSKRTSYLFSALPYYKS